jgi:hypothetical protein
MENPSHRKRAFQKEIGGNCGRPRRCQSLPLIVLSRPPRLKVYANISTTIGFIQVLDCRQKKLHAGFVKNRVIVS